MTNMTTETLFWLSGLSLAAGGLMATTTWLVFALSATRRERHTSRSWLFLNGLVIAGGVLMALGLPGFYARQAAQSGVLGLIGFVILFTGLLVAYVGVHSVETMTMPAVPARMRLLVAVGAPSLFVGIIASGVVTWQAGVYPQAAAAALIVSAILGLLVQLLRVPDWLQYAVSAVFTISMAWLGLALLAGSGG
jgi:hypothetical protein